MTAWQMAVMEENMAADEWEKQNAREENPLIDVSIATLISAHSKLDVAKSIDIDNALEFMEEAIQLLEGTPERDRLASIYDDLYNLGISLSNEMEQIRKGWTER